MSFKYITPLFLLVASAVAQQSLWGQCGGIGWSGLTTCVSGSHCERLNDYYYQCLPGAASTTSTPSTTSTAISSTSNTGSLTTSVVTTLTTSIVTTTTTTSTGGTTCPAIPGSLGASVTTLPDPFTFAGGTKVQTKADWKCRQAELSSLLQKYELGTLPGKPSSVTASYSGSTLTIQVSDSGKSISFSVTITKPSGSGPFPAIIYFGTGGASIPIPSNVASIAFNNDDIAAQQSSSSRGQGKFYTIYGSGHSAGALTAWAWGVSRIIDALELTQTQTGIDPARIGVTGCSRNGKGAFVAGALEPRVALTLPQESGAGGAGCWRLEAWQNANGYSVQDAKEIVGENVWFSPNFNNYVNNVNQLPFDHHELAGLVAPRPLYVMENPDYEWLGKISTYGCMGVARKQYQALGSLDTFGYSQVGGHSHCSFPSGQQTELSAYINKFLLGNSNAGTTSIFRTDQNLNFNYESWAPWSVPTLT